MACKETSAKGRLFVSRAPVDPTQRSVSTFPGARQPVQRKFIPFSEVSKIFFKKGFDAHKLILGLVSIFFFLSSLILTFHIDHLFVSPDETANFFFAEHYIQEGTLSQFISLNTVLDDSLFPRSVFSREGLLLPISFHGLPIFYGLIGKAFGGNVMLFLTPFFACLAVFAWYRIIRDLWNKQIALLASLFLFFHPAFWFYASRGMMHNVFFICLLLFGVWFLIKKPFHSLAWIHAVLAGFCLGLSLFVRTIEAPWVIGSIILAMVFLRKKISVQFFIPFFLSFCLALVPIGWMNQIVYGNPLQFGYTAQYGVIKDDLVSQTSPQLAPLSTEQIQSTIPFLFQGDMRTIFRHGRNYGLYLVWWMSVATMVGLVMIFWGWGKRVHGRLKQMLFISLFFFIGASLLFFYGSWTIYDNPDTTQITLANSYMRYWLPVFVMTTVFAAVAIDRLGQLFKPWLRVLFLGISFLLFFTLSFSLTFFHKQDGLWVMRQKLLVSQEIRLDVLHKTEPESVIVVDRADKLFFPHRLVRYPLRDETTYDLLSRITSYVPLYYYGISLPQEDVDYLNTKKLRERGLQIEWMATYGQESLYRLYPIPRDSL